MSEKPEVRLDNWEYHEAPDPYWQRTNVLSGVPVGHPRFGDDPTPITTSEVVGKRGAAVETQNTIYKLGVWSGRGLSPEQLLKKLLVAN